MSKIVGEIDLLPADSDTWNEGDLEKLGIVRFKAAAMLAEAINRGATMGDICYVRVDVDCPLYVGIRDYLFAKEASLIGVEMTLDEPLEGVMAWTMFCEIVKKFANVPTMQFVVKKDEVPLVRMTRRGIDARSARLVVVKTTEKPS